MIVAYAQSIYELANFASKNNIKVKPQNFIHTGAGMMYDFMRTKIQNVFGCPLYDHYGGRETGLIASECSAHNGLHILSESVYVEILDETGEPCKDGIEGEIVITTLFNLSMPLIRYRVGDRAIKQPYKKCSCGVNYPKLDKIVGRTSDNLQTSQGEMISGEFLTLTFNFIKGVHSFQIIQEKLDYIKIKLEIGDEYEVKVTEKKITSKFSELFGPLTKTEFIYVKSIEKTSTGKHLFTINKLEKK